MNDPGRLYSGVVYDALHELGAADEEILLPKEIRPIDRRPMWCYGPVFTCKGRRVGLNEDHAALDRIRLDMYEHIPPGSVVVMAAHNGHCAHAGDVTALIYRELGAVGLVTNGLVRDSDWIVQYEFPCFCVGTTPVDAFGRWAITEYHRPDAPLDVSLVGPNGWAPRTVRHDDRIYADCDGVLRIPAALSEAFDEVVLRRIQHEQWCRTEIRDGPRDMPLTQRIRNAYERGRW